MFNKTFHLLKSNNQTQRIKITTGTVVFRFEFDPLAAIKGRVIAISTFSFIVTP